MNPSAHLEVNPSARNAKTNRIDEHIAEVVEIAIFVSCEEDDVVHKPLFTKKNIGSI